MNVREKKIRTQQYGALGVNVLPSYDKEEGRANLSFALRIFKQDLKEANILKEYKSRQEFIKPSLRRRRLVEKAKYKQSFAD